MCYKKNVLSYLIWGLYAFCTCIGLFYCIHSMMPEIQYCTFVECGMVLGVAVFCGLLVLLLHAFAPKYNMNEKRKIPMLVAGAVLSVALLVTGFVLRILSTGIAGGNLYYEMAQVIYGQDIATQSQGVLYYYLQLLHGAFYFLGNKFIVAVWLQIILQMITLTVLHFIIRYLLGDVVGLVFLCFAMLSPQMISSAVSLSPVWLYMLIFSIVICFIIPGYSKKLKIWGWLFVGFVAAVFCYIDFSGILLLLLGIIIILGKRNPIAKWSEKLLAVMTLLFGAVIGVCACVFVESQMNGDSVLYVLTQWWNSVQPSKFVLPVTLETNLNCIEMLILFIFLMVGVFSFWRDKYNDYISAGLLLMICIGLCECFGMLSIDMPGTLYLYLLLVVSAGIGIEQCFRNSILEEVDSNKEEASQDNQEEMHCDILQDSIEEKQKEGQQENQVENQQEEQQEIQQEVKITFLENPLPLPKKHEKRVLDYSVKSTESDDYDIQIDENDDYDI